MIESRMSGEVQRLLSEHEPFVLATVVLAKRPTSVHPGDTAVVRRDGTIDGFVGGVCAETSVRLYALRAIQTGDPLLLRLLPGEDGEDGEAELGAGEEEPAMAAAVEGVVVERNPCLSGGSLEIFLEPHLPAARLHVIGGSPIARALARIGEAAGYDVRRAEGRSAAPDPAGAGAVIVASHGNGEEDALAAALSAGVPYVALVASPRRGGVVRAELAVSESERARLHTPAGLDIGARTPDEIALSILAQIVAESHRAGATPAAGRAGVAAEVEVAVDPVCGMSVAVTADALSLCGEGQRVYFCGPGCRDHYAATLEAHP